ncbi:HyfC [uncultured spirochete]|jgi:formate hydrogenlyase subunit 4|uniref:HyfC n=1 Tax=uncultured spirochete TaxID=156406 RepID=A0A3P3XL88_9SPIR|nr:NADH-quinone oxidoreductase subunit H [Rectinema subterraneum]SLM14404.1 HyfC [uncultured spirochete]
MNDILAKLLPLVVALVFAPLAMGIIQKVKAFFAGRKGFPVFQMYRDLYKLMHKGIVYSRSTTWVFRLAPLLVLAVSLIAVAWLPLGGLRGLFSFQGGFIFVAYLFGLARFATLLASLDTASAFEGMGANREALFAILAEPATLLAFAALILTSGNSSLWGAISWGQESSFAEFGVVPLLALVSFFILALSENSRIPVDDPTTHLELTMIHEVMILDNSGPDLAYIEYASALKVWFYLVLMANIITAIFSISGWAQILAMFGFAFLLAGIIGVVESSIARLRMKKVPDFIGSAVAFALLALVLEGIL